jgi:hypothetical protein
MHENLRTPAAIAGQLNEGGPSEDLRINQATAQGRSPNSRCGIRPSRLINTARTK